VVLRVDQSSHGALLAHQLQQGRSMASPAAAAAGERLAAIDLKATQYVILAE
jgi:hypothetical protein